MASTAHSESTLHAWNVYRNGAFIGELADSELRAIKHRAYRNPSNAIALARSVAAVTSRIARTTIRETVTLPPVFIFWVLLLLALLAPESYTALLHSLEAESPQRLAKKVIHLAAVVGVFSMLWATWLELLRLGSARGWYKADIDWQISKHFNLVGVEELSLARKPAPKHLSTDLL